jgi:hypothetical protein
LQNSQQGTEWFIETRKFRQTESDTNVSCCSRTILSAAAVVFYKQITEHIALQLFKANTYHFEQMMEEVILMNENGGTSTVTLC